MDCRVFDLGLVDFKKARDYQDRILQEVKNDNFPAGLIIYQSSPVITIGRNANEANILAEAGLLDRRGIQTYRVRRGGDVTYHGPGQIIAYPVFNLRYLKKDIGIFLRNLEEVIIQMLECFNMRGNRRLGLGGVWIETRKVSSVGVAFSNWISYHGLAVNIKDYDLDNFSFIRPCGMDINMTSLESEIKKRVDMEYAKSKLIEKFGEVFKLNVELQDSIYVLAFSG